MHASFFPPLLSSSPIDLRLLRELSTKGIPDTLGMRALVWKILLGYLPIDRSVHASILQDKRNLYHQFIAQLIVNPYKESKEAKEEKKWVQVRIGWNGGICR